jgi:simple sugar transport system ATP-binding protein
LALRGITKQFPGCLANDSVDLTLAPGEVHALLGENGAGKSTLVKIIYGVQHADAGTIEWEGQPVHIGNPAQARRLGVGMVFQHFSLFESLTVAENIALGLDNPGPMKDLTKRIVDVSQRYGLALEPTRHVHTLSVGERQRVEIVRCLLGEPRLLIMDEPTSVLTPQEVERLFETLRRLSSEGKTILYISHKLEEIRVLCDNATVLRGGKVVGKCDPKMTSARAMAEMMIGTELSSPQRLGPAVEGAPMLELVRLSTTSIDPFATNVKAANLTVRAGEIVGIAGVAGNGQAELLAALSGEDILPDPNMVKIEGKPVGHVGPRERRMMGMSFVPEERLGRGTVPEMTLADNALLSGYMVGEFAMLSSGMVRSDRAQDYAAKVIKTFNVAARGHHSLARSLSGGNLQKFIIGREMMFKPRLLVVAQPTWGVDAGAAASIHQAIIDMARAGTAVLVVSQDLDELFELCDRMAVIYHGRLSDTQEAKGTSVEAIGLLMGGVFGQQDEDTNAAS